VPQNTSFKRSSAQSASIHKPKMNLQGLHGFLLWAIMSGAGLTYAMTDPMNTASPKAPSKHRTLLFGALFPRRTTCISDEATLRERLQQSNDGGVIELCSGRTKLSSAIDISELSFELRCEGQNGGFLSRLRRQKASKCVISGDRKTRLFSGSPTSAIFDGIEFREGRAVGGGGGAFLINNSDVAFRRCTFISNFAEVRGRSWLCAMAQRVSYK
jgi:hypothetical protein